VKLSRQPSTAESVGAAPAAAVVQNGSCGNLVASSSGGIHLELPALLSDSSASVTSTASSSGTQRLVLPVTNSRPPLQQLIDGWLATLQQLPQPVHKDAAANSSSCVGSSSSSQRRGGSRVRYTVYAIPTDAGGGFTLRLH
jgi:hypothetical protein